MLSSLPVMFTGTEMVLRNQTIPSKEGMSICFRVAGMVTSGQVETSNLLAGWFDRLYFGLYTISQKRTRSRLSLKKCPTVTESFCRILWRVSEEESNCSRLVHASTGVPPQVTWRIAGSRG